MAVILKIRRGTTTQWNSSTRILQVGELGIDITLNKIKAGNGTSLWNSLPFIESSFNGEGFASDLELTTAIQGANEYTDTAVAGLVNSLDGQYVLVGDVGVADGVASLAPDGKIPDSEIPDTIARDSEIITSYNNLLDLPDLFSGDYADLTNKPNIALGAVKWTANHFLLPGGENTRYLAGDIVWDAGNIYVANFDNESLPTSNTQYWSLIGAGNRLNIDGRDIPNILWSNILEKPEVPSLSGYATETYVNNAITNSGGYTDELAQDAIGNALGTGLLYNDTTGAISIDTTIATKTYADNAVSALVDAAPAALNTLNELAAALGDDVNFSTTVTNALALKSPLSNPTFTGTVGGITKSMVGLANVDNTTDANKPVSTATQTALDLKLSSSDPAVDYYITNSGSGAYLVNGVSNGPIYFEKGKKYRIHVNANGHPFWIQTTSGAYSSANVYNPGIINNGTQNGHIVVELSSSAPQLYYACQYHSSMAGSIITGTSASTYKALADLTNVNNTTDANKPVSTATQTALNLKANLASPTFTGTVGGITKSMVGLANVDNTSDDTKPVSTATQSALNLKLNLSDPAVDYYISNSGSGAYLVNGVSNGPIYFEKGKKYRIVVNAPGHPFWIQTTSGGYNSGSVYLIGITNNGTQQGSVLVELPQFAPSNLYYACQYHPSMAGSISTQGMLHSASFTGDINFNNTSSVTGLKSVPNSINATSYIPVLNDSNKTIVTTSSSQVTVTIDTNLNVPFPIGTTLSLLQTGAGQLVIAPAAGVTIKTAGDFNALKNRYQFTGISLYKYDTDSWVLFGDTIL